jgi:hypothetical protein
MVLSYLVLLLAISSAFGQVSAHNSVVDANLNLNSNSYGLGNWMLDYFTKEIPQSTQHLCSSLARDIGVHNDSQLMDLQTNLFSESICSRNSSKLWIWNSVQDEKIQNLLNVQSKAQVLLSELAHEEAQRILASEKNACEVKLDNLYLDMLRIADSEKFDLQLKYQNATLNSSNIPANESMLLNNTFVCVLAIIAYELLKAAHGYIRWRFFINPAVDRVDLETLDEIDDKKKSKCEKLWGLEQSKHESGSDATEIIAGKYRKLEKLGSGAFGSVFLVENLQDGKRFALKEAEESVWSKNDLMEIQIMSKMCISQSMSFVSMKLL